MPNALTVKKVDGKPGSVYYPLDLITIPLPALGENDVVVSMRAAALNHRDLFIRQHLYPAIGFGVPLLADGCGVVISTGKSEAAKQWLDKRVILNPGTGWTDSEEGPEDPSGYKIMGGTKINPLGTAADELVINASELEEAPPHLGDIAAAALPLAGLTAWRATMVKTGGNVKADRNVLITGIGGGVAILALLFASKARANVWVTSGSHEKIKIAEELGAVGGVDYKEDRWDRTLLDMLPQSRRFFDAIVDGAGGDVVDKATKLLKPGGIISCYGMTTGPKMSWSMPAVLHNIELRGSTMGSRKEFADMVKFVEKNRISPVVFKVTKGLKNLEGIDGLFQDMKSGSQFGKLVVEIKEELGSSRL
ncbi:MAG: hypothetical protein M1831_004445 [Alyxoria varia]|nr:MAG: hypothetical protein M1831_004445 [Alyxoria varia]